MKHGLSIIIPAYNTAEYIQETLDSIQNQDWCQTHNNYEILIGIDACKKTLEKMKEIMINYKNLSIFLMRDNMGCFVTANTLISLAQYNKILRFDSDDILLDGSLTKLMKSSESVDLVRYWYKDYTNNSTIKNINLCAYGSCLYDKKIFDKAGGYKNWKCSCDYEFFERIKNHFTIAEIHDYIYYHRVRENSLMMAPETCMGGAYRNKVNSTVREYTKDENIYITPVITNNYIKIL